MFYAIILDVDWFGDTAISLLDANDLIFDDINKATQALKKYKGSRMKTFKTLEDADHFIKHPELHQRNKSIIDLDTSSNSQQDLVTSLENLSLTNKPSLGGSPIKVTSTNATATVSTTTNDKPSADEAEPKFPAAMPPLLNNLRRKIEAGDHEAVDEIIWSNPRSLITCSDSAVYLMAGPKYNAAHISARANKPDIMALILDTVTNLKYIRKLYPNESEENLQDRVNHLLDSYLNTPDPRQGNTPLHFACKLGHYRVVRVLLTFEGCDLTLRDSNGLTAEESACIQCKQTGNEDIDKTKQKILKLFRHQLNMPAFRDQLRKRLTMERRRSKANTSMDSSIDTSFSDIDDSFILYSKEN